MERADGGRGHDEKGNKATNYRWGHGSACPDPSHLILTAICLHAMSTTVRGTRRTALGTHTCLGSRGMELQLATNVLMIAHYFTLEVSPANYKLRFSPLPSMKPSKKLKFHIAEQRRVLPGCRIEPGC